MSDELNKLNNLLKDGVLTQEEFEKAKKKILDE
jgi:predicted Zn-dependent peptidase